ncbi:ABC transporter ATP-binding protein [Variovorax sp. J22P168]|uniref:ABC transporter ATP-binding protein n=1 Tax=Variovorax jilinensis TaxID=3053513 RepID=UPI002574D4C7|nr:ABC transporter ATP-binding protein [Variovorax sp. J22P168]MDM0015196.1 ABC transporter ATP-binding protein [Variovorax sp. J22P168]
MLEVRDLSAGYAQFSVLDNLSFTVADGEFLGILGRNGVGKTTLLKALCGPVRPFAGKVVFGGVDVAHWNTSAIARAGLALVLDRKGIFRSLSVIENLRLAARLHKDKVQRWSVDDVLDMFPRLAERSKAPGGGLSGGEQQMLAIARALVCQPRMLLLDEPTEGLAPKIVDEVVDLLQRLRKSGLTAIVVDQRLETIFDTCDDAIVMSRGEPTLRSSCRELKERPELLEQYLGV